MLSTRSSYSCRAQTRLRCLRPGISRSSRRYDEVAGHHAWPLRHSTRTPSRRATPSGDSAWSNEASVTTPSDVQTVVIKLTIDKKNYTINGIAMTMDVAPVILESRTLGPVRYVAEALGAEVAWDPVERKVTLTRGSTTIELWIGRNTARVEWCLRTHRSREPRGQARHPSTRSYDAALPVHRRAARRQCWMGLRETRGDHHLPCSLRTIRVVYRLMQAPSQGGACVRHGL